MINFADNKEKSGVNLGERPVPYYEKPVGVKSLPEGMYFDYSFRNVYFPTAALPRII